MAHDHGHHHDEHGPEHGAGHGAGHGGHDHHADWFRHDPSAEGLPQVEHAAHVSPAALGVTFVVIVFGVVFVVLILSMYFMVYTQDVRAGLQEGVASAEQALLDRSGSLSRLSNAAWIDRAGGVVRLPIDRAMGLVVEAYAAEGTVGSGEVSAGADPAGVGAMR